MPSSLDYAKPPFGNAPQPGSRVVVGLSGGVDSAVAALLLVRQGYDVQALFMKNWEEDDTALYCAAAEDLADAQAVCDAIGIPLATVNLSFEYWERVFARFLSEYQAGRTPNPDVLCNQEVKFRAFVEHAHRFGASRIATGHYAGLAFHEGLWRLLQSPDQGKDQTYFLHTLDQSQLSVALFPLQNLAKHEVRALAREASLPVQDKPDSTGICFIGERSMKGFLAQYIDMQAGDIVSVDGEVLGQHDGLAAFTVGQRQGLGIGGQRGSGGEPWYVAAKHQDRNQLIVVQGHEHRALFSGCLHIEAAHWTAGHPPTLPKRCQARIRHRQALQNCVIQRRDDSSTSDESGASIVFDVPQRAAAPGQSVAFYAGSECLGGAIIEAAQ